MPPRLVQVWETQLNTAAEIFAPSAVALNPVSENLAIADHSSATIVLVGANGALLRRWSHQDRPPAMVSSPHELYWTRDGHLAILDAGNARVLYLTPDFEPAGQRAINPLFVTSARGMFEALHDSTIISAAIPTWIDWQTKPSVLWYIVRGRNYGADVDTIAKVISGPTDKRTFSSGSPATWLVPTAAPLTDTTIAIAGDTAVFRIRVIGGNGQLVQQICRDVGPLPAAPADEVVGTREWADSAARVSRMFVDATRRLWVQRSRGNAAYVLDQRFGPPAATFDVFEADGTFVAELQAPAGIRLVGASGDMVFGLSEGGHGEVWLKAFRLIGRAAGPR